MKWRSIPKGSEVVAFFKAHNITSTKAINSAYLKLVGHLDVLRTMAMFSLCCGCTTALMVLTASGAFKATMIAGSMILFALGWLLLKLRKVQINDLDNAVMSYERKLAGQQILAGMNAKN